MNYKGQFLLQKETLEMLLLVKYIRWHCNYIKPEPDTSSDESLALKAEPLNEKHVPTPSLQSIPSPNVLGSQLPDKDILVDMDTYVKAHKLKILPYGISYKGEL
ncbi:hypothetical protein FNV43_RR10318 [Rhamnella rubrinervis]|uniref:Uncharacterized protein n=1 Tax=Rhamnella rubrinervis TaxID=2594499 RepID=A0A8K0HCE5_9ROSA|nr:hypothetical protein FNV43_RR10318 [Rhamnella rubrinervis]